MLRSIGQWLDQRWPFSSLTRLTLEEEIPGGARFAYTLGSGTLIVFLLQAVTGIMQLFFYVPATDYAYDSISFLRTKVPFGWLIHGLHYWGANLMVVLVVLHICRVFLWGAYKRPRELTWLGGTALFLTVMAFSFTGGPLHWDQRGYWAGEVGTSIAGTAPVVGDLMKRILRGGEEMGPLTLSRFFVVHTAILPPALISLFLFHIIAMRRFGSVGPWTEAKREPKGPFWPDQVFKDAITGTAVFLLLVGLAAYLPPSYSGPADPLDTSYVPKPEWNFLFLYQALKYFQGALEPVGTMGVPAVLVLLLVLLPFIDRNPERNPFRRPVAVFCAFVLAAVITWLTIAGYRSKGFAQPGVKAKPQTSLVTRHGKDYIDIVLSVLTPETARAAEVPSALEKGAAPGAEDPDIKKMSGPPGIAAYSIGNAERGAALFRKHCSQCHGPEGVNKNPNPGSNDGKIPDLNPIDREIYSDNPDVFASHIDHFIQHGSVPEGANPVIRMPAFGDTNTLTQPQVSNIEAYILHLNGIDRAKIMNPGMRPRSFFGLLAAAYGLAALWIGGLWRRKRL
ncbi:MAG: cytochrome b N-terminal domain-containing protein [Nitrospiraceae bacterium]|nr:cytochrome b N-terminal domain-containing protein [Nitrospiraceae bacterium]